MALTMAVDATCDDVETISTCSGGSADDQAQDPWPDTDDECYYPKSYYRPPRDCKETDCLAEFLTGKAKLPICKGRFFHVFPSIILCSDL